MEVSDENEVKIIPSQPILSQDSDVGTITNEVQILTKKPSLIILESDTDSIAENDDPVINLSDPPIELETDSQMKLEFNSQASTVSEEPSNIDQNDQPVCDSAEITPAAMTPSNRTSIKRRNSFTGENDAKRPARSSDVLISEMDTENHSNGDLNNLEKDLTDNFNSEIVSNDKSNINDPPLETVEEESVVNSSQSVANSDSQNIVLEFCPIESQTSNEKDNSQRVECDNATPNNSHSDTPMLISKSESVETVDLANCPTDHDSADFNMESPLNNNVPNLQSMQDKHFHNVGYLSSTPASNLPYTQAMIFKSKNIHASDNDSDSTPPFFNEFTSKKFSLMSKSDSSDIRTNSSISPLNGHSDRSNISNNSNVPVFDVQVHCDDNKEFLSLLVIKTDSDIGMDVSREYKKITKRISTDHYAADISKSNSSSSLASCGIPPLAPLRVSFTSSTSSSSIKTQDGTQDHNFTIPQRPCRNFQQNSLTIKGLQSLKNKVNEVITQLIDIYGADDANSPMLNLDGKKSVNSSYEYDKKNSKQIENGNHPTTPRSSKKKVLLRHKRPPNRLKKDILPTTTEEAHIEGEIHSPEMIGADPIKCHRPSTPLNNHYIDLNLDKSSPKKDKRDHGEGSNPYKIDQDIRSEHCEGTLVLAKWVDKSYYLGKVKEALEGNKYVIEFYDRKVKTLYEDFIIFGNSRELPILGQSVYAIIESKDNYEPSLVLNLTEDTEGNVLYNCTTDRDITVSVKASDIYVTEDQAKSIKESCAVKSPYSTPNTPRRRVERELNLDNIIHGPRSARYRDKCGSSRKELSLSNVKASTSGILQKRRNKDAVPPSPKLRHESESSEGGDCNVTRAPSTALEEVGGVQPEIQKTPRKIEGVMAGALLIKGMSKQNAGKRSSKVSKFDDDSDTNNILGPIPSKGSTLFKDLHFLLTCTDIPQPQSQCVKSCDEDAPSRCTDDSGTEKEEYIFAKAPFNKERLKEQLEAGGGIVYSHFEDIPKSKYSVCKLIAPRPCFTAKYIQCLGANIRAFVHIWVVQSCQNNKLADMDANALPSGWSFETNSFVNWQVSPIKEKNYRLSATPFKDYLIILCSDNESFIKFWRRVCTLAGGETRTINEDDPDLKGGLVVVTERDCPHEVQNKANQDNIPLVSTDWVVQSLIMGKICSPKANIKYSFNYSDAD